jgi:hypothetical protein
MVNREGKSNEYREAPHRRRGHNSAAWQEHLPGAGFLQHPSENRGHRAPAVRAADWVRKDLRCRVSSFAARSKSSLTRISMRQSGRPPSGSASNRIQPSPRIRAPMHIAMPQDESLGIRHDDPAHGLMVDNHLVFFFFANEPYLNYHLIKEGAAESSAHRRP